MKDAIDYKQPLILIVDDHKDNLLFARYIIESLGMRPAITDNSEKCLKLVKILLPDLILLDIVMPGLNGIEITRIVKQDSQTRHIPIIAVTGLTRPQDTSQIIEVGFDDYIIKPYLIEELECKIYSYLKHPGAKICR